VIGNVAALADHKGQRHLIGAMPAVLRHLPDARLAIVGSGELQEPLRRQIHDLGLARHVVLAGFRPDAAALMKSFDVFVMSSITEGLGSAILEAMACGRPVVATRTGGIPEAVAEDATGLLVPPAESGALATALVGVLKDPVLASRLGIAGRRRVEQDFSVERLVAGTVDAYHRRLERR
jgi:glycosyltransferase involved in cell wall biosynthesis